MPLLKFTRKKRIVPISATTDIVVVDSNGYIGEKRPNGNTVYFGYLDAFADYSKAGLGQVTIIPVVIGKVTIGGREYKTTKIGNQEWLAENLDYKFEGIDYSTSQNPITGQPTTAVAWYYNDDETTYGWNGLKCGLLYNWYAVDYLENNKSTLIPGWHVSTYNEWDSLRNLTPISGTLAKQSSEDTPGWNGTNAFLFNVFASGSRRGDSSYSTWFGFGTDANYWTKDMSSNNGRNFYFSTSSNIGNWDDPKTRAYSLRLVKDSE